MTKWLAIILGRPVIVEISDGVYVVRRLIPFWNVYLDRDMSYWWMERSCVATHCYVDLYTARCMLAKLKNKPEHQKETVVEW